VKRFLILIYLTGFILACKPVKREFISSTSYIQIENTRESTDAIELISPYKAKLEAEMNVVLGVSDVEMIKMKDVPESQLGNFVADLVLEFARTIDAGTDCSIMNNGGLRNSLPKGNITVENVYELMPFDNEIVVVEIKGEDVEPVLPMIAERGGVPVSGMTMVIERINGKNFAKEVKIGGEKFSKERTYKIATSDYLAGGGDQMTFWVKGSTRSTGKKIRDAIMDYIRFKTGKGEHLNPTLDDRITYFN
jgi:2',3'-cyclic-nucleotide 2'-phosphodiesterase (5'-nucleotidase family)